MLTSGAMTSTPGVITSFSCIGLLLPHAVPCARVAGSRVETPHRPYEAAGMARANATPHARLALSAASFIPPGVCGPRPRGKPGAETRRGALLRVAGLLRL